MKWLVLVIVVAAWFALARFFRQAGRYDAIVSDSLKAEEHENARRRRALNAVAKPMPINWRLRTNYSKDGRDHQ